MIHECPDCSHEPEPIVVDNGPTPAQIEKVTAADVEIARLQSEADVKIAKLQARSVDEETAAQLAALQARIDVLEASRAPVAEPEPAIIEAPQPEPGPAPMEPPPAEPKPAEPKHKPNRSIFGF